MEGVASWRCVGESAGKSVEHGGRAKIVVSYENRCAELGLEPLGEKD